MIRSTIAESSPLSLSTNILNQKLEQAADTGIIYIEFSLLYGQTGGYLARLYNEIGDAGGIWFIGIVDVGTGKAIEVHAGRKRIGSLNDNGI